jgi:hypothetical protein
MAAQGQARLFGESAARRLMTRFPTKRQIIQIDDKGP